MKTSTWRTPPATPAYLDFDKARQGNLSAEFFSIWVDDSNPALKGKFAHRTLDLIDAVYQQAQKHPDQMRMCFSAEDIIRNHHVTPHKLCALMGIEGGHSIENDLGLLRDYYRLGVRYMTLTWSNSNDWADSSGDIDNPSVKHHNGLTEFGKDVVREMNRLGMMVDISHVSDRTFLQRGDRQPRPRDRLALLRPRPHRCSPQHDRRYAARGRPERRRGHGQLLFRLRGRQLPQAMDRYREGARRRRRRPPRKTQRRRPKTRAEQEHELTAQYVAKMPRPPLSAIIDHIDHIAKVAGIDHVGIGSDFDGIPQSPAGHGFRRRPAQDHAALVARGYNEQQIHKILGGNFLRVFAEVERVSKPDPERGAHHRSLAYPLRQRKGPAQVAL